MRRAKGVSGIIATALLILITVVLAAAIWLYTQRFTQTGDVATAQALLVTNRYVGGKQNIIVDLAVTNTHNTRLQLVQIRLIGAGPGGTGIVNIPTTTTTPISFVTSVTFIGGTYNITISPPLASSEAWIEPRNVAHFTITLQRASGGQAPSEIGIQVVLRDDAGNIYTIQSNTLKVG